MDVAVVETLPQGVEADVLAFTVRDPVVLEGTAAELDRLVGGRLGRLVEEGELKGERGAVTLLHVNGELSAHRLAAAGVGEAEADADGLRTAAAQVAIRAGGIGGRTVAWVVDENGGGLSAAEQARAIVDGIVLGAHDPGRWKTDGTARVQEVDRLVLCGAGAAAVGEEARAAGVVAAWTNRCRDLVNAPANELTPAKLADAAQEIAARFSLRFEALGPEEIGASGMGAFAGVSQGSDVPPRLITIRYEPEGAVANVVLGLVGKALTFDSGGLSLKPADRMEEMKSDMGGGAAVLCGLGAIAELGLPVGILAVIAACENMPGGHAYRPGDILTAMNGKTIEVTNTDAEGRLVLADALCHARQQGATHLLDLATLTGGMVVAMGDFYAGVFGNDAGWVEQVRAAGEATGDHVWAWPLHGSYRRYIDSTFADMKNSSDLRQASPMYAANFLAEFAGNGAWAHLDIAGTAFLERGREDYYGDRGATGYGVRLLAELARRVAGPHA